MFLCAFLSIAKSTYCLSNVWPSVHMHLHGSHRMCFCELILGAFIKICQGTPDLVKLRQQYWVLVSGDWVLGMLTWRPKCVSIVDSSMKYSVAWQQCKGHQICICMKKLSWQLHVKCRSTAIQREDFVAFPWQQLLHKHATTLCYVICLLPTLFLLCIFTVCLWWAVLSQLPVFTLLHCIQFCLKVAAAGFCEIFVFVYQTCACQNAEVHNLKMK
jgi:hypothetical protein